jgi:hypothetical protein
METAEFLGVDGAGSRDASGVHETDVREDWDIVQKTGVRMNPRGRGVALDPPKGA